MKTLYIAASLLLLSFFSSVTYAQTEYGNGSQRIIGTRYNSWNTVTSMWVPADSGRRVYNSEGLVAQRHGEDYVVNTWTPSYLFYDVYSPSKKVLLSVDSFFNPSNYTYRSREAYVYNGSDQIQIITQSRWNTPLAAWGLTRRYQYSYTGTGRINIALTERFRSYNSSWVNDDRTTYTYDGNDYTSTYLSEKWDTTNSTWKNTSRGDYTYDGNGHRIMELYQTWNGSAWVNSSRYEYTYDSEGRELTQKYSTWSGGVWVNNQLSTRTYSAQGIQLTYLDQSWNGSLNSWVNDTRYVHTLGGNGFPNHQDYQQWDNVNSVWKNYYQYDFIYNNQGYLTFTHIESWNTTIMGWANAEDDFYWYEANPFAGITDRPANKLSLMVFPNPTADVVTVHSSETSSQQMEAVLLDAAGREVSNLGTQMPNGEKNYTYNLNNAFAPGLYYLSVKAGNSTGSMPLIIK